ncbi:hypothetical protein ACFOYU_00325 [Microvirga sp. GCM10011540]|uniref:hypothetical protein n=1 Tax=Microvirga sp. GCM10011540 TaxID=3317338 RepID=UPI00360FE015
MNDVFLSALVSLEPHPDLPPEQRIFAPFIGSWDLVVTWYAEDGTIIRRENGEWHFSWVLEGRAVQDIWIVPPRHERPDHQDPYEYGTSLRFFDPVLGVWRSTWIGPTQKAVHVFLAHQVGNEIVLETNLEGERRMRWIFTDVADTSFTWRNQRETATGWLLTQDFQAHRDQRN